MQARHFAHAIPQPLRRAAWLLCLGLPACQPTGGGAPLVSAPASDPAAPSAAPVASAAPSQDPAHVAADDPSGSAPDPAAKCPADTHRQWTCGRPSDRGPDTASAPVAVAACPKQSSAVSQQWRMVSFPGAMGSDPARTLQFRQRGKDEAGQPVDAVCCYSACVQLDVRATADPPPADHNTQPLCIAAGEANSSLPAKGRADCPAAIKLPGYASYGAFNPASTTQDGPQYAARSGFPEAKTCCYDGLAPKRVTR